jgi:hypothetical protein
MKALSAAVGILVMLGSVALTAQSGTPVGTGAPAGRHATSKTKGTSGTSHAAKSVRSGAPAGRHATSKSTSHGKKHAAPHKKLATSEAPMSS